MLYYYVLLSRFLTIHPYSRAEVLLTFLAYINRKSFWLLSDEDKPSALDSDYITLTKTEIIHPKNGGDLVAMNFI